MCYNLIHPDPVVDMAMPSVRASRGMLRSSMRPARLAAPIAPQMRTKIYGADKGDLNGPKGQEEIPQTPSGADAIKRNWYALFFPL